MQGKSPYECLHNKSPSLNHLRNFMCLCFAIRLNNTNKFAFQYDVGVFMGYSPTHNSYVVMNVVDSIFHASIDLFHESVFLSVEAEMQFFH